MLEAPWPVDGVEQELFGLLQFRRDSRSLVAALTDDRSDLLVTRPPKPQLFRGGSGDSRDLGRRQRCLGKALDLPANAIADARRELHSAKGGRRKTARCHKSAPLLPLSNSLLLARSPARLQVRGDTSGSRPSGAGAACSTWSVEWLRPKRSPRRFASSRRIAWQSAPGSTRTCADTDGNPLPTVQTWRSWTSETCGTASIAAATSRGSAGAISSRIRVDSRRSTKLDQKIRPATTRLAIGSHRSHPVASTSAPAAAVPMNAARSVATCKKAPRTFRLSRLGRARTAAAARFTTTPASATTSTIPPRTSDGSIRRRTAA